MLAACTTFTACNSDESSLPTAGNQLQLSFGINAPQSRAIFTDTKLPDDSPVGVRLDGYADYANLVYTGTTISGTQSWASTTSVTLTDTKGTLYAYWPQNNAVSIDAIDVDMTAADQTDWLYATPVTDVNEDKASVAVTMNHALANINVTVNKGSYLGAGNITNITLQSDGIALGGTFNAAQTTPGYTAFEDEGKPLSRTVTTTAGAAATDIMVVPTGTSATVTFLLTIDGIQFTAKSAAVQLAMGNSYQYTLNLSDISTYMEISGFSVKPWTTVTGGALVLEKVGGGEPLTWDNAPNGVYAVSAEGVPVAVEDADESCIAVALIVNDAPVPQYIWLAKDNAKIENYTFLHWGEKLYNNIVGWGTYSNADGIIYDGYLPGADGSFGGSSHLSDDFTTWSAGALSDFDGRGNTAYIISRYKKIGVSMVTKDMCYALNTFNAAADGSNGGKDDWYIPACGQLALIYLNMTEINAALEKIGGTALFAKDYWSSSENDSTGGWGIDFSNGIVRTLPKDMPNKVRFVRDITTEIISFTIDGNTYQAEEYMTWTDWVASDYNTAGFLDYGGVIMDSDRMYYISSYNSYDVIKANFNYRLEEAQGGGAVGGGGN